MHTYSDSPHNLCLRIHSSE